MLRSHQVDTFPEHIQPLIQDILQWLTQLDQANTTPGVDEDPSPHIEQLTDWQQQLTALEPSYHLLWCFSPHLCVRLGLASPHRPITDWVASRLQGVEMTQLHDEAIAWGELAADTILSARHDGWRIDLRYDTYRQQVNNETQRTEGLWSLLEDPEDVMLWRQELNLAHEWGHMFIESHIPYQEPLLEKLSPHHPEQGAAIFSWFEALLEGLAECAPEQGALSFLAELGQGDQYRAFAAALLWERKQEMAAQCPNRALAHLRQQLILPTLGPNEHNDFIGTFDTDDATPWDTLYQQLNDIGEQLQAILLQTIPMIPSPGQTEGFVDEMIALVPQNQGKH